jgi:MFS family permease
VLIRLGVAVVVSVHATAGVVVGLVLLGIGNGMATLARATAIADLYGPGAYGTIAGIAGSMTTVARALAPVAGALFAASFGYVALPWTLAALARAAAALAWRGEHAAAKHAIARTWSAQLSQPGCSSSAPGSTE